MYQGWASYGGTEIINAERTRTYARALLPTLWMDGYDCPYLHVALDDDPYTTPAADGAPWYDPDVVASDQFLGFYPLGIRGVMDSTGRAVVDEAIGDGGFVYSMRNGTKEMRFHGLLIGTSKEAAEVGLSWLKTVTQGSACAGCDGDDLCFLVDCASTVTEWERKYRVIRSVTRTVAPKVIRESELSCGGWAIEVDFVLTATIPWIYSMERQIATASGATLTAVEPGSLIAPMTTLDPCSYLPSLQPLLDPDCDPVPEPPVIPDLATGCGPEPSSWFSYSILIPSDALHSWQDAVPMLTIKTGAKAARHVRVRFIPRIPDVATVASLDPCSTCASFDITYIPPSTLAVVDGMRERITMQTNNAPEQAAEHLVDGVGTDIFDWPLLSCGIGYFVIVDVDADTVVDLSLWIANREE